MRISVKREFLQARGCQPCWESRGAALIAAAAVTTVSTRATARNASSAVYAGVTPSTDVCPETLFSDGGRQVLVGDGDDAHVRHFILGAAQWPEMFGLQCTEPCPAPRFSLSLLSETTSKIYEHH